MEPMLTVKEIANILNISYKVALELVKTEMKFVRVHRQYRVPREDFERFFAKQRRKMIV